MEFGEVLNALACLVPAALLGWAAVWAGKWGTPRPPAPPRAPAPAPVLPIPAIATAVNAPWQMRHYEPLGDSLKSFMAKDAAATTLPGKTEAHREAPARPAGFIPDVLVPFFCALISGLFVGGVAAAIASRAGDDPLFWFAVCEGLTGLVVWFVLLWGHNKLLWVVEDVTHSDLDGDGNQGKPPAQSYSVHIDHTAERGAVQIDDLPEPRPGALHEFARAITLGLATFSEDSAHKYGYTRPMWRKQEEGKPDGLVDIFIKHGWAVDKGGKRGVKLTGKNEGDGESIITGLAEAPAPSPGMSTSS